MPYQRVSARIIAIANGLRELGVESALELPTLVIAGDQSSGKSSVVEAIAGVALPRADGTCTRCPTEVRLRAAAADAATATEGEAAPAWSCQVKLCRDHDAEGNLLPQRPAEEPFCSTANKDHLAACVTAAQAVLLNPGAVAGNAAGVRAFVPDLSGARPRDAPALKALSDASRYEQGFTYNKVVIEIDGADANLTIIDLPGVIHNHAEGQRYVKIVEQMTKRNIAPAHHIIAMTLPAGLDPETQAIRLWAREVDPHGSRSIGVISKADTIKQDAHVSHKKLITLVAQQQGVLAGGSDAGHLKLGFYVVVNPGQEQLDDDITFQEARAAEAAFFNTSDHWSRAVAASPRLASRLGAANLRSGLSALLVEQIEAQLPDMRRRAREQLHAIAAELQAMPLPPREDAVHELRMLLLQVAQLLEQQVAASTPDGKAFYQQLSRVYKGYGTQVIRSTPAFLVGTTLVSALSSTDKGLQQQASEGDLDLATYLGAGATDAAALAALEENAQIKGAIEAGLFPQKYWTLQQVADLRERHLARELPTFSPYSAVEELLRAFKGRWCQHAQECLEEVAKAAQEKAAAAVAEVLGRYPKAMRAVSGAMTDYLEALTDEAAERVKALVAAEDDDVFTLNDHYFRQQHGTFLGRLKRAFIKPRALTTQEQNDAQTYLSYLSSYGATFKSFDELFMAQPTRVDDELHMMAGCLAYYKVAFKRIQDGVPMHIRARLLDRLKEREALQEAIMGAVLHGQDHDARAEAARQLLAEDEAVGRRRRQLRDTERRLREALAVMSTAT